ncbi:hypothetical protein NDN08_003953 [Rhodosorus marinus]|uniref:Uncharacterized protein n=1 Tax=Rhodosorus marinus TaxID=101924 RepID=A0AAV8UKN4_9RHOD|nr:hypothetical protein NDN08_003953 [Rhodosorus marinus]
MGGAKRKRNLQKNDPVSRQKAYFRRQKMLRGGGESASETGLADLGVPLESVQPHKEDGSQIKSVDFFQIAPFEDVLTHVSKMRAGGRRPKTVRKDTVTDDEPTQPVPHSAVNSVPNRGSARFNKICYSFHS